ncbi:winged helix-turn-helix transcriptional regulator [Pseudoflavonifractor sp. 524-17]|uniref:winged helix-turn-helix transcriptional regulator n=1 Tax=Pseudoflavonifractor sp. 524-17 TaxID=2304577 RepID=UPI0013794D1B|nr:winged helix-turn-helix transcriptional regulator [Pseudoflavonifractor sp. 524-17]NCE64107.1 winged helix-turn-helix transcriptional regulator [Pseudoflavonifractor sp. 524-17]
MNPIQEDILIHYGVKRRSGRYPWGSGENPYQHGGDFLSRVEELQRLGKSEKEIAQEIGLSTTDLRMQVRVAKHERRALQADRARSLRDDGKTLDEIASIMGFKNDSSVRALLNESTAENKNKARATAEILKKELAEKGALDVGTGVERTLGVSTGVLQEALFILETEGYNRYGVGVPQVTDPKKRTITPVISVPEIDQREVYQNLDLVKSIGEYHSADGGDSWDKREYPASIDSSRVKILYGDEGGTLKDGVIEIRRGVADLDLGDSHYAQVRILVDGTHYLKGMAMYSDEMPDGADIVFNTNKRSGTPKMDVMKPIQDDPDNPFGALIKANGQSHYIDADGTERLSAINKLKEEGDWDKMSKNLSSQFLSKQPIQLIRKQLDLTYADAADEFAEICALTNPTVKRKLLLDFADECDSAAVHLKAAALPRQSTQVILPLNAMKETEIFAPNYRDGEQVALVRYPHGGTFEIPVLTVNNKNPSAISILGKNIRDAVGINPKVAERLSGADFDGDQVVVIPTGRGVKIQSTPALKDLEGFDPKTQYSTEGKTGVRLLSKGAATQRQMGEISNLITDMTLKGAPESEIARAVKHSMVVIDAAKHKLDYRQSEKDNGIPELRKRYQGYTGEDGKERGGASTLLSRRKQTIDVPERRGSGVIDPVTGKVIYKESGRTYIDPESGKTVKATTKVNRIEMLDDVRKLSSGTLQEEAYAEHANRMKGLANQARREYKATPTLKRSASAAKAFEPEVTRLTSALRVAQLNAPREREAQRIANARVKIKVQDNNITDKDEIAKIRRAAINDARAATGASGKRTRITISDGEWTAIQAGAISDTTLSEILRYAEPKTVRERATPRATTQLSQARINRIKALANSGHTNAEIAETLGISTSAVSKYLNE